MSGAEAQVKSELHSGLTDFGVFVGIADTIGYSSIKLRQKDVWGVLTRIDGPVCRQKTNRGLRSGRTAVAVFRSILFPQRFDGWLNDLGSSLNIVGTFNLLYNAYVLAAAGVGHVLALGGIINPTPASGLVWLPFYPRLECDIVVAWDRFRRLSPAAERLITLLKEEESLRPTI